MQFSAKTKNEAITKACIELGVSSDQLDIQVVSEGSSGFFGIGSKPAIIKARKVDDNSEEKEIEKIVDSVKINAFKEDTVKETQKSAPKSVSRQNDVKVLMVKDYIQNPKPNGYRSYHMVISVPIYLSSGQVEMKVEIQIRTIAMDFWASLEHKINYKFEGAAPAHMCDELKECADMAADLDRRMLALNESLQRAGEEKQS